MGETMSEVLRRNSALAAEHSDGSDGLDKPDGRDDKSFPIEE
jgi:hypothetical protein